MSERDVLRLTDGRPWLSFFRRDGTPVDVWDVTEWLTDLAEDVVVGADGVSRRVVTKFCASSPPHQRLEWGPDDAPLCWATLMYVDGAQSVLGEYTSEPTALEKHPVVVEAVRVKYGAGEVR